MRFGSVKKPILRLIRDFSFHTGILRPSLFSVYPYMYTPAQLEFLLKCLRQTKDVPGACMEVGCAYGATTVFLRKFLDHLDNGKTYYALDTFSGFKKEHANYETTVRKKDKTLVEGFNLNRKQWVSESLRLAGVMGVELIECDASEYDFSHIGKLSFCLIDVDLYQPISAILPKVYEEMHPGGIIVVDDCQTHEKWDGALAVYEEFIAKHGLAREITCDKLGVIRKVAQY